jgi:hypothetical protein
MMDPPEYEPGVMESPSAATTPAPARESQPVEPADRGVEVRLDDCMENAGAAGYSFSARAVVSCEDSAVDVYLSYNENGGYYFLVPEDTQIKDAGSRYDIRNVRLIKPANWSPDHAAPLVAGHAYVVWASTGDLYLVHVDALWDKHVMFTWLWHSRLSREDAEKFLRENAAGPQGNPYFAR